MKTGKARYLKDGEQAGWVTRLEAAEAIGRTPRAFDNGPRAHIPGEAVRSLGREARYHLPTVVALHVEEQVTRALRKAESNGARVNGNGGGSALKLDAATIRDLKAVRLAGDDLALVLGDSTPTIDRLRMIGIARGAFQLAKERKEFIPRETVRGWLLTLASKLHEGRRDPTQRLRPRCGARP